MVSEGEIVGLVSGLQSIFLDGIPVQNNDGSFNFQGLEYGERTGMPDQDYIPGFDSVQNEILVDQQITNVSAVARTVSDEDVDVIRVKIKTPTLTKQDPTTGDLRGYSVSLAVEVQPNGGAWKRVATSEIKGKTTSDYERSLRIDAPTPAAVPWQFRVVRLSADSSNDATIRDKTFLGTYTEIIEAKLTYPDSALISLAINAEQFGDKVPTREYQIRGLIVNVPSNYDPETREYTGVWDGTFKREWTDNPAWCFYDMCTNDRYGLGQYINTNAISKGELYLASIYCDELVSDGYGGVEPRFTLNVQIRTREDAYTLLRKLASTFRAVLYWGSGSIIAVQDSPADYEYIASPANVVSGIFNYSSSSLRNRSTAALITYSEKSNGDKAAIEVYEDSNAIFSHGWRQKDIVAFGCNSRGLARRIAKWEIENNQNETDEVSYKVGLDHLSVRPGSVIAIADPTVAGLRLGGRIASVSGQRVYLDRLPDDLDTNYEFEFACVQRDGTIKKAAVNGINLEFNSIDTDQNYDVADNAMWILSAQQVEPRLFRVSQISANDDNTFSIKAIQYDKNKYQRIENNIYFDDGDFTELPSGPVLPPVAISVEEYLYEDSTAIRSALIVSASFPDDARVTSIQFQVMNELDVSWQSLLVTLDPYAEILNARVGQRYDFRARCIDVLGRQSAWVSVSHNVQGKSAPPPMPENFRVTIRPETGLYFERDPSTDIDYKETSYRAASGSDTVQEIARIKSNTFLWDKVPAGDYQLHAIDFDLGNLSSPAAIVDITINNPSAPVVEFKYIGSSVVFAWSDIASDFSVAAIEIYRDGDRVGDVNANTFSAGIERPGSHNYEFIARDIAGNKSGSTAVTVDPSIRSPSVTFKYIGSSVVFTWSEVASDLSVAAIEIYRDGDRVGEVNANTFASEIEEPGSHNYEFIARDIAGNKSVPQGVVVEPLPPSRPNISTVQVGPNIFTLIYNASSNSLPIDRYIIKVGDYSSPSEIYDKAGSSTVTTFSQDSGGEYNYWVNATDTAGNISDRSGIVVPLDDPDNFKSILEKNESSDSFGGQKTNILLSNGTLLLPVDKSRTIRQHYNGFATIREKINAGYPHFQQPTQPTAQYIATLDSGIEFPTATARVDISSEIIAGDVNVNVQIEWAGDDGVYQLAASNNAQAAVTNVRYVRALINFIAQNDRALLRVYDISAKLLGVQKSETGQGIADSDALGTFIPLSKKFIDIDNIDITVNGQDVYYGVDWDDPNPDGFRVRIFFNNTVNRYTGDFGFRVDGA